MLLVDLVYNSYEIKEVMLTLEAYLPDLTFCMVCV